ncbi:PapD-like protein [Cunninghamella echinulata]|nr:PapD-like protein [Cunninghamella echinulata]
MSVQIEPSEVLSFKRPLTRATKETLTIRNTSDQDIAFKVKTTAPKLYCVRPNSVMLQPFKEEPPAGTKCKDKFLVQTVSLVGELKAMELQDIVSISSKSNNKDKYKKQYIYFIN